MSRLVYTYWTNKGTNYLGGFHDEASMMEIFEASLEKSKEYFDDVIIYCDQEGKDFLVEKEIYCEYVVIDYDMYEFNPKYWNFPKLITYALQEEAFLHIDMDVILETLPQNLHQTLICEKIRGLVQLSSQRSFLPKAIRDNFSPHNICSGILGGDPKVFKKLLEIASHVVKEKTTNTSFTLLFGIEEIILTSLCKVNDIQPSVIDCKFTHYQSSSEKLKFLYKDVTKETLKI